MSLTAYPTLLAKLKSKKFRTAFLSSSVRYRLALQTRALRKAIFDSQKRLGEAMGKPANVISRLENPNYGKVTLQTLLDLASAFDVGLVVEFASFNDVVERAEDLSEQSLIRLQFEHEVEAESISQSFIESILTKTGSVHKNTAVRSAMNYMNGETMNIGGLASFRPVQPLSLVENRA